LGLLLGFVLARSPLIFDWMFDQDPYSRVGTSLSSFPIVESTRTYNVNQSVKSPLSSGRRFRKYGPDVSLALHWTG